MIVRAALTVLLLFPAAAHADSIALSASPDPTEEVGWIVTATGAAAPDMRAFATVKPAGGAGCGATYNTDAGGQNVFTFQEAEGAFSVGGTATTREPGRYLVCGWVQESTNSTAATATASLEVRVRSARARLRIKGPKRIRRGRTRRFRLAGSAELSRFVFATVKRGRRCGRTRSTDSGRIIPLFAMVQGRFSERAAPSQFAIAERGRYVICAWVNESHADLQPEARARYRFRVGRRG